MPSIECTVNTADDIRKQDMSSEYNTEINFYCLLFHLVAVIRTRPETIVYPCTILSTSNRIHTRG